MATVAKTVQFHCNSKEVHRRAHKEYELHMNHAKKLIEELMTFFGPDGSRRL